MTQSHETSWGLIERAAGGEESARQAFAKRYGPWVERMLANRWRRGPHQNHVEDATNDVFVECLRPDGALSRVKHGESAGFRGFLHGVARNVARRYEHKNKSTDAPGPVPTPSQLVYDGTTLSQMLDRDAARSVLIKATAAMTERASRLGGSAIPRLELLKLRFRDGLPIRDIATRWNRPVSYVHHQYAKARAEFRAALVEVVKQQYPGTPEEVEARCRQLIEMLG